MKSKYMLKIQEISKVWASWLALFLFVFLVLGTALTRATEAFGQNDGSLPQCGHTISNSPPNPTSTPEPLCAHANGAVFGEDPKMVKVTIYVSTQEELYEALKSATGGETILLAAGDYGNLTLSEYNGFDRSLANPIEIRSLDPDNPASFSEVHLRGVSDYKFSDLVFDYNFTSSDPVYFRPFTFDYCKDIQIFDSIFEGDVASGISEAADGYGYAYGLSVRGSENITISGNEFTNWARAAIFSETNGLNILENNVHSIRMDGFAFAQVSNVLVEKNYFHDFILSPKSGDHCDYIQFWTTGTSEPSKDILIRENILDIGSGGATQSIFIRNEEVDSGRAGFEFYYQNIVIEQNLILGSHLHGISIGETSGLTIQGNTLLAAPNPESELGIPTINIAEESIGVSILENAVARINGYTDQVDWNVSGNAFIQNTDPNARGYYSDVFVESSMFGSNGVIDYVVAPGSIVDNLQAGYKGLFSFSSDQSVRALFDVSTSANDMDLLIIDGRYSFGEGGASLPDGTTFLWTLGTGETFFGPILVHRFDSPGQHDVELLVTTPDGSSSVAFALVSVAGQNLLSFDKTTGSFLTSGYGETETVLKSDAASAELSSGAFAIDVGGSGTQVGVSRHLIERIFGAESLSLSFSIQADAVGSYGELFRLHSSFVASITATGELLFQFFSGSGEKLIFETKGAGINNGALHEISIVLDDRQDSLSIAVDGSILGETAAYGTMPLMGSWDLSFGNPWGGQNFDGKIHSFDIEAWNRDYPVSSDPGLSVPIDSVALVSNSDSDMPPEVALQVEPISANYTTTSTDESAIPEIPSSLNGYRLDLLGLATGNEGALIGNAYIDTSGAQPILVLDGKNDGVRLGSLNDAIGGSKRTVDIDFALSGKYSKLQSLVSDSGEFFIRVDGDSIEVTAGLSSKGETAAVFNATNLSLADGASHSLRVVADADSDRLQILVDNKLVLDSSEQNFSFDAGGKSWWSKGWAIGEGDRSVDDFEGSVTSFAADDTALFVSM